MPKVKTFNVRIPKPVRDFQNKQSPLGQGLAMKRHGDFKIQEVPPEEQIFKLQKGIKKLEGVISRLAHKKFSGVSDRDRAIIESKILKKEDHIKLKRLKIRLIRKKQETELKKVQTRKENLTKEMDAHIKNLEKRDKFHPEEKESNIRTWHAWADIKPKELPKKKIDGKIKPVGRKRWSQS